MSGPSEHPLRTALAAELHARPFVALSAPCEIWHLAFLLPEGTGEHAREHLARLCRERAAPLPAADGNHYLHAFGPFSLKWELHTEFVGITLWAGWDGARAFERDATDVVAATWLADAPGELLVSVKVALTSRSELAPDAASLAQWFAPDSLCASRVGDGSTEVWTDFQVHADGATRMLVRADPGDPLPTGRRVQRLLEVETYRTLALLALPLAREVGLALARENERLLAMTACIGTLETPADEERLLRELTGLSADIERRAAASEFRFSAAEAYRAIVRERLEQLAPAPVDALPSIAGFMDRRLSPAMRTCESVAARQDRMLQHVTRSANLLRTRVDLALESQNRELLASMDRRAALQLRLQQTVEGLSIAAITYYGVGLVHYLAEGSHAAGLAVDADIVAALAVPVVAVAVWRASRRVKRWLRTQAGDTTG